MAQAMAAGTANLPRRARSTRYLPMALTWELVIVVALLLAARRTITGFVLAGVVVLGAMLFTIPVNGRSLFATLRLRLAYSRRQRRMVEDPDHPQPLVPLAQWLPGLQLTRTKNVHGGDIGVVADGSSWCGLLEVNADNSVLADRGAELDLSLLGALTRQDDVVFAGIQVVTLTVPAPSRAMLPADSSALEAYLEVVGADSTPPAVRRTWVALRLDPRLCLEAVARRGQGQAGVFATLRFGLHRAQALLKRQGVLTSQLDPNGIGEVLALTTCSSAEPTQPRSSETWRQWACDGLAHETREIRSFGKEPTEAYQRLLDVVAQSPAVMVVTSFTVSPGEPARGAIRQVTHNQQQADQADEELLARLGHEISLGPLGGTQVPGMLATVPLGRQVQR